MNLNEKELIDDLIRVARLLKKDRLTQVEYTRNGHFGANTFLRKFGTWFKAFEKAGLKKTRNLGITEEEYFRNLEEVWIKLGRQPHYNDIQKPLSKYSPGAYVYRFGTWRKALEKFIAYINQEEMPESADNIKIEPIGDTLKNHELKHKTKINISLRLRFIIMKRDNFKCRKCGQSPATDQEIILHVDHIAPYSKGGETVPGNLQTLCSICNIGKSNVE